MKKIFFSITLFVTFFAFAQVTTHTVAPKETLYGISKQYGITQDELKNANPFLSERGLQIGDVLQIPTQQTNLPTQTIENYEDDNFYYHVIQPKETLYTLAKQYNTTQETVTSLNPFIEERGLQINDIVRFPKKEKTTEEVVVPDGMHLVKPGETVYGIAKKYFVEMADIYAYNRNIQKNGLKPGEFIKIPNRTIVQVTIPVENGGNTVEETTPKQEVNETQQKKYFEYTVKKGDTIFSILRKYSVSLNELIAINPELQNGLQEGMTLKIPWVDGANIKDESNYVEAENFSDNEINIVWMMPFFLDEPNAHKGKRQVAQDFYMGGQIALDRLIKEGKNINVEIFDVQGNTDDIDAFLASDKFKNVDAVIGPFFKNMVEHVAQKLVDTNVPIFSPLTNSESLDFYKNVYLTTPRDKFAADVIVEEMAKAYNGSQQVKILTTNKEEDVANYVKSQFLERFADADVIITRNSNDMNLVEHKNMITVGEGEEAEQVEEITYDPILAVLVSENNSLGKQFVNTIKEQDAASIDGFSVYFVPALDVFDRQNANNINALKKIGFTYTATRMVNTFGNNEKQIMKDFKERYCSNPSKYMSIGYDVVYDVVDRMNDSGKISDFDAKRAETRLSSKIGYEKTKNGNAKINKELRVIRLKK